MKSLVFFVGVCEGFTPATRKHTTNPGFFGHTLIAQKKGDVLSDKLSTRGLTSGFFSAIMTSSPKTRLRTIFESENEIMYTKDKLFRITLRLNEEQFTFVKDQADILGVSPSEFLRMVVNASLATNKKLAEKLQERIGEGRENDKADINNIV